MTSRFPDLVPAALRRAWAADGSYPDLDLYSLYRARRTADPHRTAVIDATGKVCWTRLDVQARCLAAGLAEAGIRPGDVVGVQLPNNRDAVMADLALAALGAVALPFPVGRGTREAMSLLARSEARAVIAAVEYRGRQHARELAEAAPELPALRSVVAAGRGEVPPGCLSMAELLRSDGSAFTPARPDPDEAARILVSSGSETEPKMVAYSHNALAGGRGNFLGSLLAGGEPPRCLFLVPLASAFGSNGTAAVLARHGGTLVLLDRFDPEAALDAIRRHRPTHVLGVPTMVRMMLQQLEKEGAAEEGAAEEVGSGLTALVLGGSPLDASTAAEARRAFGCRVVNLYGSADGVNCHTGHGGEAATADGPGIAVGRPDPAVASIRIAPFQGPGPGAAASDPGADAAPGEVGEILALGPMTPMCYVGTPELNVRYRTRDGWVRTGDLGVLDADGGLRVVGRLKEIVIRGGANISPAEVEGELSTHPDLRDVMCVGVPDPLMGEVLAACVVPRPGRVPTLQDLCAHLERRGLDRCKHPERLLVVTDRLPLTPAGKPDRAALRRRLAAADPAQQPG
ncbi:class I adenylate-forming enzyme family protein [Peterkaempfera bronchialis]|uniref:class I adenylate-forming enzyme family protein n=1 Tax=Peterkaempfera bronchialis TaxID=2126346 RepID=UPI003C2CEFCB